MNFVIEHLSKRFEDKVVLRDICFTFTEGRIYGLLGRNGAGKTTLFNCLNRDLKADGGAFWLETDGRRSEVTADDIGYVLSTPTVPEFLTGREFLRFFLDINEQKLQNPKPLDAYFDDMSIAPEDRDKLMKDYSHGMKNKMQMLINIIAQPNILLLDEPLTSLDVVVAEEMKQLLRSLKQGRITIFSTHIMDLALDLCDEIVLLSHGELEVVEKSDSDNNAFKERIIAALRRTAMRSTFRLSFALKNTYRVNGILYSLKQIPLLRRLLPQALYRSRGLKRFAGLLAAVWELLTAFLGKLLYMLTMVTGVGVLYENAARGTVFLHILLCLTVIGGFMNTGLFNPTRDKYYAMILMRMDARSYTLVNYAYTLVKVIVGFLPFTLFFGLANGVPLWLCLVLPFSIAGCKLTAAALTLRSYEKRGRAYNENAFNKRSWLLAALLLAAAYGLPAVGASLPPAVSAAVLLAFVLSGALSVRKLLTFGAYREINQELLGQLFQQMDTAAQATKKNAEKAISADCSITSHRRGFAYLNELFVKRHRRILWSAVKKIAFVCAFLIAGAALLLYLLPEAKAPVNALVKTCLPYFVFVMYAVNRGTGFTQALFMNCDHSLLTYSFYKKPRFILKLFRIRLLEIMKINALPALVIGPGLSLLLYLSGGTDDPLSYIVLPVAVLCISMFFSVHYLTIYYLLQPYNAGTELKSGAYTLVMSATYLICFSLMQLRVPVLLFGLMTIVFCVLYCALACVLIYKLAPKTFRIRT